MKFHKSPTTYVGNVVLKVGDIDRSVQFYEQVIGLKVLEKMERKVRFTADGKNVLLTIEQPNNVIKKTENKTGLYHFALLMPEQSDLANIVRHFINIGIQFGSADHLVSEALYLADPDGNGIEIYIDRHPDEWTWQNNEVNMTTDALDFNILLADESETGWEGLPKGTVMGHIHLQVADLKSNERFYVEGLGFNVVSRFGSRALFISDNHYHHHIALNTWASTTIPNPTEDDVGLASYSVVFPDKATRDKTVLKLKDIAATVVEKAGSYVTYDPSGIRINLEIE